MVRSRSRSQSRLRIRLSGRRPLTRPRLALFAWLACVNLVAGPAGAQGAASASTSGAFDYFVLALSWSPTYCGGSGRERSSDECAAGRKLGFVLHGLWPQNERGYPTDCARGAPRVPRYVLDATRGLYPSVGLEIHEWRAHGTCTGVAPSAYFAQAKRALAAVRVPPQFQNPTKEQSLSPTEAVRAFVDANPGLRPGMLAVTCRRDFLDEARICMTKDLRSFRVCPDVVREQCKLPQIKAPVPR